MSRGAQNLMNALKLSEVMPFTGLLFDCITLRWQQLYFTTGFS